MQKSKKYSENIQQIYRRTAMLKYDVNKVAKQHCWNLNSDCVHSCKFAAYIQHAFS